MEKSLRFRQVNLLAAILFAALPVIQIVVYIMLALRYSLYDLANFSTYLSMMRCGAYVLLAIALIRAKQDKLFISAFTLPAVISLISLILHYQKIPALLDLAIYGSLYVVVLAANGYIPKCKKATQYLCLLPGVIGALRTIFYFSFSLSGILFSICFVFALLVTGFWSLGLAKEDDRQSPVPLTKLPGTGLIQFGALFLISMAVNVACHWLQMIRFTGMAGITEKLPYESYLGVSVIELLLCFIVSICAIYGGILLCYKKKTNVV